VRYPTSAVCVKAAERGPRGQNEVKSNVLEVARFGSAGDADTALRSKQISDMCGTSPPKKGEPRVAFFVGRRELPLPGRAR